MKHQIRMIRISFLLCALFIIISFWIGFYFGNTSLENALSSTENSVDLYTVKTSEAEEVSDNKSQETLESMNTLSPYKYYLKQNGIYLAVYKGTSEEIYFETDLKISDLPESMKEKAEGGIAFDNLEDLYEFLENYSS